MAPSDEVWNSKKEIKLALVGDAGVGKTTWVSELIGPELPARATATAEIGYKRRGYYFPTTIGTFFLNIWDISGSHTTTAQERAQWIHDSDAAIIMVDLADRASIENVVYWYNPTKIFGSDEMGNMPVLYESYVDLAGPEVNQMEAAPRGSRDERPIKWILEQLIGQKVEIFIGCCTGIPAPTHNPELEKYKAEMDEAAKDFRLPDEDDGDL
ncbi:hypothetical protein N7509_007779 [Penicillium cosmopolitanum]|uniref:Uncharacterized protein n=1 Tax=Penicillium cosmopolitanum TaxID=1131564 RepID=A0A9W9VZJ6_9EURO|nr:uncharacterized protein N7509_007779 [Penicillium cosmopolitanum]KAJ5392289.1 hypothetical protein N7509_007779 [Penicillium cosmopolitanum]